ncbi:hypothetical protein B0H13DRAFT_1676272, partial [Mycena leptocephala]
FTLQFPGRTLNPDLYAWGVATTKPTIVAEAEFKLVDQLYDLALVVGGPNGSSLSVEYSKCLNNLIPKQSNDGLVQRHEKMRGWCLKSVPVTPRIANVLGRRQAREDTLSMPSRTFTQCILLICTDRSCTEGLNAALAPNSWSTVGGKPRSREARNLLTRDIARLTVVRQSQLASKYADAVISGHSHTVREYLAHLDVVTPATLLQDTKDSLREAAITSLDGNAQIYPVQLSPRDWFADVSTSFPVELLVQDVESIRDQIRSGAYELDSLAAQLVQLKVGDTADTLRLQGEVQSAQAALNAAQNALSQSYPNAIIQMAYTMLDPAASVDLPALAEAVGVSETVLAQLPALLTAVQTAESHLSDVSRDLTRATADLAFSETDSTWQREAQLRTRIQTLTADLRELQRLWRALTSHTGGLNPQSGRGIETAQLSLDPKVQLELPQETASSSGRWTKIAFKYDPNTRREFQMNDATALSELWSCDLWSSSSSVRSASLSVSSVTPGTIDVAFRSAVVMLDRPGWFQPAFFQESKAYYKASEASFVNPNISWVDGPNGVKGRIPGFPVAFLIVKDIMVRVVHESVTHNTLNRDREMAASSSRFLCFSYNEGSSSLGSALPSSFQAYANGYIVRIPGPQILGYMIERPRPDQSQPIPEVPTASEPTRNMRAIECAEAAPDNLSIEATLRATMERVINERIGQAVERMVGGN